MNTKLVLSTIDQLLKEVNKAKSISDKKKEKIIKSLKEVQGSYGHLVFSLGETDEEEVRNVYAVLRYLVETNSSVYRGVAIGYSSSAKWQDKIKGFNERFVMVLIRHVE